MCKVIDGIGIGGIVVIAAIMVLLALPGCGNGKLSVQDALTVLERGRADGHLVLTSVGSPLGMGQKTVFWLGPEMTLSFDGDIDFATPLERAAEEPED